MATAKKVANYSCSVVGCFSRKDRNPNLNFHTFPKEKTSYVYITDEFGTEKTIDRKKAWEMILLMKKPANLNQRVCSLHFQEDDYLLSMSDNVTDYATQTNKKFRLHSHAIPTLNLPQTYKKDNPKFTQFCAVVDCNNQSNRQADKKFFSLSSFNQQRWVLWMNALGWDVARQGRVTVCSDHFIKGIPSSDKNDPDYVPSKNMPYRNRNRKIEEVNVTDHAYSKRPRMTETKDPLCLDNEITRQQQQQQQQQPEFVSVQMGEFQFIKEEPEDFEILEEMIKVEPVDNIKIEVEEIFYHNQDHSYCK